MWFKHKKKTASKEAEAVVRRYLTDRPYSLAEWLTDNYDDKVSVEALLLVLIYHSDRTHRIAQRTMNKG